MCISSRTVCSLVWITCASLKYWFIRWVRPIMGEWETLECGSESPIRAWPDPRSIKCVEKTVTQTVWVSLLFKYTKRYIKGNVIMVLTWDKNIEKEKRNSLKTLPTPHHSKFILTIIKAFIPWNCRFGFDNQISNETYTIVEKESRFQVSFHNPKHR